MAGEMGEWTRALLAGADGFLTEGVEHDLLVEGMGVEDPLL
jgi:hypothetical protein